MPGLRIEAQVAGGRIGAGLVRAFRGGVANGAGIVAVNRAVDGNAVRGGGGGRLIGQRTEGRIIPRIRGIAAGGIVTAASRQRERECQDSHQKQGLN